MRKIFYKKAVTSFATVFFICSFLFSSLLPLHAYEIKSDPTFIVINFSDSFHFLNWTASEDEWQTKVKPEAIKRLRNMKQTLDYDPSQSQYVLAWSTLMEYTNYPADTPSDSSPYIVRLKRMMELAEEENFPIFIPLNGVQWWDEMPELWNHWDHDGNQTLGCKNDEYTKVESEKDGKKIYRCTFEKLRDPAYRERFIKGYNPENKWNVDWQDWETPMKMSTRNWGGGDMLVAPPPNIVNHNNSSTSFNQIQTERYRALIDTISQTVERWDKEGKQHLFAGMGIGTEVSLYGSLKQNEIKPYGYRALQDIFCPKNEPLCGKNANWSTDELRQKREQILFNYFNNLAKIAHDKGLPKQRVYSHVWNEKDNHEEGYVNGFGASITLYSRPGQSVYGIANNPYNFSLLTISLKEHGSPSWAAPEFAPLVRDEENWKAALYTTFTSEYDGPKLIDIYNETDILNTAAIPQLKAILRDKTETNRCTVSETIPTLANKSIDPLNIQWNVLNEKDNGEKMELILWDTNKIPSSVKEAKHVYEIPLQDSQQKEEKESSSMFQLPKNMPEGTYYWAMKRTGCNGEKWTISNLSTFIIQPSNKRSFVENVKRWWIDLFNKNTF